MKNGNYKYNFYPRAIYQFLNNLAFEKHLSIKEVEITLLRKQMEFLGFACDHVNVKNAEKTGEPFCMDCWTRLEQKRAPVFDFRGKVTKAGEYWPMETFLDKIYKSEAKKNDDIRVFKEVPISENPST